MQDVAGPALFSLKSKMMKIQETVLETFEGHDKTLTILVMPKFSFGCTIFTTISTMSAYKIIQTDAIQIPHN